MDGHIAFQVLMQTKRKKPLVHILMNSVAANSAANAVLQVGGLPVMADSLEEAEEIVQAADALVLNTGMLNQDKLNVMLAAGKQANQRNIPVILDPVGVGSSQFRRNSVADILKQLKIDAIKGNASEMACIAGLRTAMRGVDAAEDTPSVEYLAHTCAQKLGTIAAVTGKEDAVSDGEKVYLIHNGHQYMSGITGFGCMATAVTGAFSGADEDPLKSVVAALVCMGVAGEIAAEYSSGPGSFFPAFLDELYALTEEKLVRFGRIRICTH